MTDVLIIFARYPEVGTCKTRLISALGPEGATSLHQAMTQHTLAWARQLCQHHQVQIQVRFAGGNHDLMRQTFGDDLEYVTQSEGDLGRKLQDGFVDCQQRLDAKRIVVVGTDCPELNVDRVWRAFQRLDRHDVCVIPASDGGYVLLGVNSSFAPAPQDMYRAVFHGIHWGTATVMRQTAEALAARDGTVCLLPTLSDVDVPDDLPIWDRAVAGHAGANVDLSIIVPILGHEAELEQVVENATGQPHVEVILVAAGDRSQAVRVAAAHRVQLLCGPPNRSAQMNLGAAIANGQTLLFLHADTRLPKGFWAAIHRCLEDRGCIAGAFQLRIDSSRIRARIVELGVRLRCWLWQLPYGDQAIFVRRADFERLGGFKDQPIMEDYDLVQRLRKLGRVTTLPEKVVTSARRWNRLGFLRTMLINQLMLLGYYLGISPQRLADFYRGQRKTGE